MGAVAAASGTVTEAISTVVNYFRTISRIKNEPKRTGSGSEHLPEFKRSDSLEMIASRNPVTRAAKYSANHLQHIAYELASKSLAPSPELRKKKKTQSFPLPKSVLARRTLSREKILVGHKNVHGKTHDALNETGHFVEVMLDIGLKGI